MQRFFLFIFIAILVILPITGYAQDDISDLDPIVITISLYVVVDNINNPDPDISSEHTVDDMEDIVSGINEIWADANIIFEPQFTGFIELPEAVIDDVLQGNFESFLEQKGLTFDIPDNSWINGFYFKRMGRLSGISFPEVIPGNFLVSDAIIQSDRQAPIVVSAHEAGHILGLHHEIQDNQRLMAVGASGTVLTEEEITVARYIARGIVSDLRTSHD